MDVNYLNKQLLMLENLYIENESLKSDSISAEDCFQVLSAEEKEELKNYTMAVDFEKGETIIKKGFVASSIIYIEKGLAKLDIMIDGKAKTVGLIPEKSFIGIMCTFANRNINFTSVALEKTRITLIDIKFLEKAIKQNGVFAFKLIKHMSWLTNQLIHHITRYSHKNIDGALSILLIDFANIYKSESFTLPINRIEMANILGYSKESVINTLSKFKKDGLIDIKGHKISLLNRDMIQHICELG
jgi:CRP-like cAMP-binding protein